MSFNGKQCHKFHQSWKNCSITLRLGDSSDNVDELIRFKDSSSRFNLAILNSNNLSDCEHFFASSVKTSRSLQICFWFRGKRGSIILTEGSYWGNIYASQDPCRVGSGGLEFSVTLHTRLLQAIIFNININQKLLNCTKDILHAYFNNLTWYTLRRMAIKTQRILGARSE